MKATTGDVIETAAGPIHINNDYEGKNFKCVILQLPNGDIVEYSETDRKFAASVLTMKTDSGEHREMVVGKSSVVCRNWSEKDVV